MTLLEQWRGSAYNENMTQEQYNQFWNHYFVIEDFMSLFLPITKS